jgi:ribosomal protein L9
MSTRYDFEFRQSIAIRAGEEPSTSKLQSKQQNESGDTASVPLETSVSRFPADGSKFVEKTDENGNLFGLYEKRELIEKVINTYIYQNISRANVPSPY